MKGRHARKRARAKASGLDLALRGMCHHNDSGVDLKHKPTLNRVQYRPHGKNKHITRAESRCLYCAQPIVGWDAGTGPIVWRTSRYIIEELPW